MTPAFADTSNCDPGDAPAQFVNGDCESTCYQSAAGDEWICDLSARGCDSGRAYVVHDYGTSGHDFNGFGDCTIDGDTNAFCCTFDDDMPAVVKTVKIVGSPGDDEPLAFTWDGTNDLENLGPHAAIDGFLGFIHAGTGDDVLLGSNYTGNNYRDNLYGEDGHDTIYGNLDGDFIDGGYGHDTLYGGAGDDRLLGATGDDQLYGEDGHDTLCDVPCLGAFYQASAGGNLMDGGAGNDTLWYEYVSMCATSTLDPFSTGGAGNDVCGATGWDPDLPDSCAWTLTAPPATCTDPN